MATIAQFDASRRAFTARASHRRSADRLDPVSPLALCALIEGEIIPRLMVAHHGGVAGAPLRAIHLVTDEEVGILAPMALAVEADLILAHVEGVLARGVPLDTVLIDLMAPTARLLGEWWEKRSLRLRRGDDGAVAAAGSRSRNRRPRAAAASARFAS